MIRERVKKQFFGEISPKRGWVGWLIPKQGPNPSKPPQITPKISFFDPNLTIRSLTLGWVGGWINRFGRDLTKKLFLDLPLHKIFHLFLFNENFNLLVRAFTVTNRYFYYFFTEMYDAQKY